MSKYMLTLGTALVLAMSFAACEAEDEGTDAYVAPNPSIYEACMDFRQVACEKFVDCGTFGGMTECQQWFDGEDGYMGCNSARTEEMNDAATANFEACLVGVTDFTNCAGLTDDGIEASVPSCANWP